MSNQLKSGSSKRRSFGKVILVSAVPDGSPESSATDSCALSIVLLRDGFTELLELGRYIPVDVCFEWIGREGLMLCVGCPRQWSCHFDRRSSKAGREHLTAAEQQIHYM